MRDARGRRLMPTNRTRVGVPVGHATHHRTEPDALCLLSHPTGTRQAEYRLTRGPAKLIDLHSRGSLGRRHCASISMVLLRRALDSDRWPTRTGEPPLEPSEQGRPHARYVRQANDDHHDAADALERAGASCETPAERFGAVEAQREADERDAEPGGVQGEEDGALTDRGARCRFGEDGREYRADAGSPCDRVDTTMPRR